jgi:hypothetical protein
LKCEKFTDDGRQTPSDGNSSHGPGELKRDVPNMARKTKMTPDQNGRYYGYTKMD